MIRIYALTVCFVLAAIAHVHGQTNTIQLRNGSHSTTILPSSSSTISVQIPSLTSGTHYLLTSTTNPGSSGAAGSFISYGATSAQNSSLISATNYLFNVSYASDGVEQNALGGLITATATGTNTSATALTLSATGTGSGTSDALYISNGRLKFLESTGGTYFTTFKAGDQSANINYTLPTADGTSGQALITNGSGVLSWGAAGATNLDGLSDAKSGGTGFANSIILGHETTGILVSSDGAEYNTAVGYGAMQSITTGNSNTATGYRALKDLTTGSYNTAYGQEALRDVQTSSSNTAFGYNSLLRVTSGAANTALGVSTGLYLTTGSNNIMVGREAGWGLNTADGNVAIGYGVFRNGEEPSHSSADVGSYNVAIGYAAMYTGPTGADNVGIGRSALTNAYDATLNVALGLNSGTAITSGDNNTLLGVNTGQALVSGSRNVFIGISAGSNTASDASDLLYIDNSNTNTPLIYGDFSGNTLTFNGAITTTGTSALNGNVTVGGGASASEVRFLEPSGSGSNYTAFKAQAQGSDITYTLPASIGTANQVLSLQNTDGTLEWATASSLPSASTAGTTLSYNGSAWVSNTNILGNTDGSITLQKTTNQIVLGTGNTTTITSPAPSSSRTYTIPDAGTNASFVMTAGTQTVAGDKTFSGATTNSGTTIYSPPGSSKAVTATTNTDGSGSVVTTFTNTYEKVAATATSGAGYIKLPTGTEGQIVYLHITFTASGSNTVTVINSTGTNTAMVFDGTGADEIVAHMLYTTTKGWVVFSALEYDN